MADSMALSATDILKSGTSDSYRAKEKSGLVSFKSKCTRGGGPKVLVGPPRPSTIRRTYKAHDKKNGLWNPRMNSVSFPTVL